VITTDEKGKQHKKYPYKSMMTRYEKLKSLPKSEEHLKDGVTFDLFSLLMKIFNTFIQRNKYFHLLLFLKSSYPLGLRDLSRSSGLG